MRARYPGGSASDWSAYAAGEAEGWLGRELEPSARLCANEVCSGTVAVRAGQKVVLSWRGINARAAKVKSSAASS